MAGTVALDGATYRLDGIDAPALDQMCIDEHADPWACGVEARDQLAKLIGSRPVRCDDLGLDPASRKRHVGICTVEGETASLNQLVVRRGFAVNLGHFKEDEAGAKDNRQGVGRAALSRRRNSAAGEKTALCWADRAEPTRTAKYARCCSPTTLRCHQGAASRANSRFAPASPGVSASISCRPAQLPCPDQAGSLVLFGRGCPGRGISKGV